MCHKCGVKGHLATQCKRHPRINKQHFLKKPEGCYSYASEEPIFNLTLTELGLLTETGNVEPTYLNLIVENIPISFEADTKFAHSTISEKMYLRHFQNKTFISK